MAALNLEWTTCTTTIHFHIAAQHAGGLCETAENEARHAMWYFRRYHSKCESLHLKTSSKSVLTHTTARLWGKKNYKRIVGNTFYVCISCKLKRYCMLAQFTIYRPHLMRSNILSRISVKIRSPYLWQKTHFLFYCAQLEFLFPLNWL